MKTRFHSFAALVLMLLVASCTPQPVQTPTATMNTDFLTLAAQRYSVRHFSDTPVEQEKLDKILEAGRLAPTAVNSQPQRIYVIQSSEAMEKLRTLSPCVYGAPHAFLFCYDSERVCARGADDNYGDIDVTIVLTHMMLEAANLGVGTCPVGYFDQEKIGEALGLPATVHPILLMPFGYAAPDAKPSDRHTASRPLTDMVEYL